jgi:thiamine biosynthesis lipoprotein
MVSPLDRRQFLDPRLLGKAAGATLAALDADAEPEAPPPHDYEASQFLSVSRRAMACLFEVLIPATFPGALDAASAALDEIDRLESQLTVYRDGSEVSRLNAIAAYAPVPVEERLFELLCLSERLSTETEGAFDITAGALIKCWGFFRGPRRVPPAAELESARQRVGMNQVVLDPVARTVRYLRPRLEINLGSIGKGHALDRVVELLRRDWNLSAGLLHGGYSSVYALGVPGSDRLGWRVGIRDPRDPAYRLATVRLRDRALGTSAATFQHLDYQGRKLGHILDPRTGWPAEGMLSASVAASTAAEADALATAFFILGVDKARAYCEARPDIGAVLIPQPTPGLAVMPLAVGQIEAEILVQPQPLRLDAAYDE